MRKQLLLLSLIAASIGVAQLYPEDCSTGANIPQCTTCPPNAVNVNNVCTCNAGFARTVNLTTGSVECIDCTSQQMVVSSFQTVNGSQVCVPCGADPRFTCLEASSFNSTTNTCTCAEGSVLIENVGTIGLTAQMCATCSSENCAACEYPYVQSGGACVCEPGFTSLPDASCVNETIYNTYVELFQSSSVTLSPPNIGNQNGAGSTVAVALASTWTVDLGVQCSMGNSTACNYLANLCVLLLYDAAAAPCAVYMSLLSNGCNGAACNPNTIPPLYYNSTSAIIVNNRSHRIDVKANQFLQFYVSSYALNGTWLGMYSVLDEFNLCDLSADDVLRFYKAGGIRAAKCLLNWNYFFTLAPETVFYELFLQNPSNASDYIPIPVLMLYSNESMNIQNINDLRLYRSDTKNNAKSQYRHRFYMYDSVGGKGSSEYPSYVTAAIDVMLYTSSYSDEEIPSLKVPLLVVRYASKEKGTTPTNNLSLLYQTQLATLYTLKENHIKASVSSMYLPDKNSVQSGLKIALIIFSAISFFTAWVATYGWMRRRQNLILDATAAFRFLVYLCSHIANAYLILVVFSSWYCLISYKSQYWLSIPVATSDLYVNAMLYTAIVTKGVAVLYRLVEQCNADYFVIDWERSKGQLQRENKVVPVSMWRSTFIANELHELQTLRYWHPLLSMGIILLFIIGLEYINFSYSFPLGSRKGEENTVVINTLRVAVDTFFWVAVPMVIYMIEYQIYFNFVVVHPLQAFVDLCSVSNLSIIVLLEPNWGFYFHGESIHAHSDVSMEEFQNNLFLESQGNLPVRGLGGLSTCQTFEVFLGGYTRQYLYLCYAEMEAERLYAMGKSLKKYDPAKWHFTDFLTGLSKKPSVYTRGGLAIKERLNTTFQQSVRRAEGTLLVKFVLQKWFDFPPNILYMNGQQSWEKGDKDLFFIDQVQSFGRALMCGLDFDIFLLYTALFTGLDIALHNVYAAFVITFAVEVCLSFYRNKEGVSNLSRKTLIDDRFFI
ncbi:transmembrane protein 67 [Angomonas deanei]|nr:transmembrane protein 67 [Angomonas deanei]|eukprot:EPY29401.1 transmembrane protein 67 [Angomonas deanei]